MDFAAILKLLDDLGGREVVVVMATNHPEKLDEALQRPGRIDMHRAIVCDTGGSNHHVFQYHGSRSRKPSKAFWGLHQRQDDYCRYSTVLETL